MATSVYSAEYTTLVLGHRTQVVYLRNTPSSHDLYITYMGDSDNDTESHLKSSCCHETMVEDPSSNRPGMDYHTKYQNRLPSG